MLLLHLLRRPSRDAVSVEGRMTPSLELCAGLTSKHMPISGSTHGLFSQWLSQSEICYLSVTNFSDSLHFGY
ncbi:hypothetical protein EJB05_41130, partial [Eragrostis curvula]